MKLVERVAAGARLLDIVRPNWVREFNQSTLNMRDMSQELLTQIFGSHHDGLKALGLRHSQGCQYGFDLSEAVHHRSRTWAQLRDAWIAEANKRLAA